MKRRMTERFCLSCDPRSGLWVLFSLKFSLVNLAMLLTLFRADAAGQGTALYMLIDYGYTTAAV